MVPYPVLLIAIYFAPRDDQASKPRAAEDERMHATRLTGVSGARHVRSPHVTGLHLRQPSGGDAVGEVRP